MIQQRKRTGRGFVCFVLTAAMAAIWAGPAHGELKGFLAGWKATAEISYVLTGGNSSSSTFSLGNTMTKDWEQSSLSFKTYILRSHSTTSTRSAVGTEGDFEVVENRVRRLTAENYLLAGQYNRKISEKLEFQTSLNWDRNHFSGIDSRFIFTGGAGYGWIDTERTKLKTNAGLTYTLRKFLREDMTSFAGFRLDALFDQKIGTNSSFTSQFIFDENLKRTKDWRYDWTNSLAVSINKSLALKTSLRWLYSHLPANESVPLFDPSGADTGLTVLVPYKKLDTFFTTSLVINF